jgi:AraC family transcriptional regulator
MLHSQIKLIEVASGSEFPAALNKAVLLSSAQLGWRGIKVESHNLAPMQMPEHYVEGHRLMVAVGKPILFEWKEDSQWRHKQFNTGDFCLQTHGDVNAPRWTESLDIIAIALEPEFVSRAFRDASSPPVNIAFETERCVTDPDIARFAARLKNELKSASYAGRLYGESLAIAFALHLIEKYGRGASKLPVPRGKLSSAQVRRAVEFIHENLAGDLSIETLASEAYLSAFHFARLFKQTLGLTPHQYVLQNRIERAKRLIVTSPRLNLTEISLSVGFFDQSHFTNAFKRVVGATPKAFLRNTA